MTAVFCPPTPTGYNPRDYVQEEEEDGVNMDTQEFKEDESR